MAEHAVRSFETGATRDTDTGKYDYEALVVERYAAFMHSNRQQSDGQLRDGDNWQRGIPKDAYMKSLMRHVIDIWLHHRGYGHKANEPLEVALCAVMFNAKGYLYQVLTKQMNENTTR